MIDWLEGETRKDWNAFKELRSGHQGLPDFLFQNDREVFALAYIAGKMASLRTAKKGFNEFWKENSIDNGYGINLPTFSYRDLWEFARLSMMAEIRDDIEVWKNACHKLEKSQAELVVIRTNLEEENYRLKSENERLKKYEDFCCDWDLKRVRKFLDEINNRRSKIGPVEIKGHLIDALVCLDSHRRWDVEDIKKMEDEIKELKKESNLSTRDTNIDIKAKDYEEVLKMVEDHRLMPHPHTDAYTKLCCLSERANEVLKKHGAIE